MDNQLTLRLPADLARRLATRARSGGVKRSQVVREALQAWLADAPEAPHATGVRERIGPYVGALSLDRAALERDELARRLRTRNWRK